MSDTIRQPETPDDVKRLLWEQYGGENRKISDGNYDSALAVKCKNGTFVGRKTEKSERAGRESLHYRASSIPVIPYFKDAAVQRGRLFACSCSAASSSVTGSSTRPWGRE